MVQLVYIIDISINLYYLALREVPNVHGFLDKRPVRLFRFQYMIIKEIFCLIQSFVNKQLTN